MHGLLVAIALLGVLASALGLLVWAGGGVSRSQGLKRLGKTSAFVGLGACVIGALGTAAFPDKPSPAPPTSAAPDTGPNMLAKTGLNAVRKIFLSARCADGHTTEEALRYATRATNGAFKFDDVDFGYNANHQPDSLDVDYHEGGKTGPNNSQTFGYDVDAHGTLIPADPDARMLLLGERPFAFYENVSARAAGDRYSKKLDASKDFLNDLHIAGKLGSIGRAMAAQRVRVTSVNLDYDATAKGIDCEVFCDRGSDTAIDARWTEPDGKAVFEPCTWQAENVSDGRRIDQPKG